MAEQPRRADELDEVNAALEDGLRNCHALVDDFRLKLAANLNDRVADNADELEGINSAG